MTDNWRTHAACAGAPYAVMFPTVTAGPNTRRRLAEAAAPAKALCARCPVTAECETEWNAIGQPAEGVWFGTTSSERGQRPSAVPTRRTTTT